MTSPISPLVILLSVSLGLSTVGAQVTDVAGGNHHTYWLLDGVVYSTGQDLHRGLPDNRFIGGKLGRPIDDHVLPGADPSSAIARANYNPSIGPVEGLEGLDIVNVSTGQNDGAAITADGALYMWGVNDHGQLGQGDLLERAQAVRVNLPEGVSVSEVVIGNAHTLALTTAGQVYGWGLNRTGVLGLAEPDRVMAPTLLTGLTGHRIVALATGQNTHSLFLTDAGLLFAAGRNPDGVLGLDVPADTTVREPTLVPTEARFQAIGVGVRTSFAIDTDGHLWGWGDGSKAHFGLKNPDGSPDLRNLPTPTRLPNAPANLVQVAAGSRHTVVRDASGDLYTWGIHTVLSGQLGIGEPQPGAAGEIAGTIYSDPQQVTLSDGARATFIDSMANNVFVVTTDGRLFAWGQTAHGRLGDTVNAAHQTTTRTGRTLNLAYQPVEMTLQGLVKHPQD